VLRFPRFAACEFDTCASVSLSLYVSVSLPVTICLSVYARLTYMNLYL